ncbi:MAG: BatA domain-containing protein, partial [Verrucomicrobiota bacterium]
MTFLNALLLGGVAAGIIPLAIHLLHRKKRTTVQWGAMQFLLSKTAAQSRRLKLEHWLLLLLRISIPVLLALCMARPVIESLHSSENNTPESVVLLVDNSASMNPATAGASPFLSLKQAGEFFLSHLPRGSEVTILPLSNPDLPLVEFSVDTQGASRLLKKLSDQPSPAQIAEGLESCAGLFSRAHHVRRRVVLMTDFQKSNWSKERLASCEQPLARLRAQKPSPSITLYDAGTAKPENVAVESIDFSKLPVGPGQTLRFTATLRNHGHDTASEKTLQWKIDGKTVSTKQVFLKPQDSAQISIERAFGEPGIHTVEASTEHDDYPFDDSYIACVEVYQPLNVLLVNGHPSPESMQGETDFLELALQPKTKSSARTVDGILRTSLIEPNGINAKTLLKYKAVVLADTRNLTKQQVQDLESFISDGGGLLFFPGIQTDVDWSNKILYAEGRGILPARIDSLQNTFSRLTQKPIGISKTSSPHIVAQFFTRDAGVFDEVAIDNWYSLKLPESGDPSEGGRQPTVILSLENGEPLFVERRFGKGIVIQGAIPCSTSWTNLPTRPAYVPLMQRLTLHGCMSAQSSLNITAGQPLVASFGTRLSNQPILLTLPDGTTTQCLPTKDGTNA